MTILTPHFRRLRRRRGVAGIKKNGLSLKVQVMNPVLPARRSGIKEVRDDIWRVSLMDQDLGYFDVETPVLETPFGHRLSPM